MTLIKKSFFQCCSLFLFITAVFYSCSSDDNNDPVINPVAAMAAWGDCMAGNDPNEITWPDLSENYWFYPMDLEANPGVGLRITGQYPTENTRFFNITVYDDNTTARIDSKEDFNITPNDGDKNPFGATGVTGKNYFEINIVPEGNSTPNLKNKMTFPVGTKKLSLLLRIYFNSIEHRNDFGGVELPKLIFFDLATGKDIKSAERTTSFYYNYFDAMVKSIPVLKKQPVMVFTLAPNLYYVNGPTGYVTSANRINTGEALCFRFIPPTHPKDVSENRTADVRYWSICVGDTTTHTPFTLVDRSVKKDGEYVNVVIVTKNDPNLAAIKANKAVYDKINLLEWDIEEYGEPLMVFYRQMYIHDGYEHSVRNLTPYPPINPDTHLTDPSLQPIPNDDNLAHKLLAQHGPFGVVFGPNIGNLDPRMSQMNSSIVLASPNFNTAMIRIGQ